MSDYAHGVFRAPRRVPLAPWAPWLRRDSWTLGLEPENGSSRLIFSISAVFQPFQELRFGRVLFQGTDLEVRVEDGVWGFGFHE